MELNAVLHDGESQTCAAHLAASSLIHPVETLEDAIDMLRSDTYTVVGEAEIVILRILLIAIHRDLDSFTRIGNRIVVEITEDLVEERIVSDDRRIARQDHFGSDVTDFHLLRALLLNLCQQRRDIHLGQVE